MPPKDKYTDPELRDQVKEEIHESDKGGAPGQWSARKAQMMASEYKKRGGSYTTDKDQKDESQQNLSNWGDEEWQTKEGSGNAKKEDGTEKRYLPKKAWEKMTDEEKEATDAKKQEESKEGKQHVGNTDKAKESRKQASKKNEKKEDEGQQNEAKQNGTKQNGSKKFEKQAQQDEDDEEEEEADEEYEEEADAAEQDEEEDDDFEDDGEAADDADGNDDAVEEPLGENDEDAEEDGEENAKAGQKRKQSDNKQSNGTSKKQKDNSGNGKSKSSKETNGDSNNKSNGTVGSKHMSSDEPAPKGSADRLPKKGQKASWKSLPGYVNGEVVDILTKDQEVDGKNVKASEKDPKILLKSSSSGKTCVHKPEACFYE